jgi:hypothetical protein
MNDTQVRSISPQIMGQHYEAYEAHSLQLPLDQSAVCEHIFVSGIDIGQCGEVADRTGQIFRGVETWLRVMESSLAPLDVKLTNFENKGDIETLRPEDIFALLGETEANMTDLGEFARTSRKAAEEAALIPWPVSLSVVDRIKKLYAESKDPALSPEEALRLKNQIKATIQGSDLFGE